MAFASALLNNNTMKKNIFILGFLWLAVAGCSGKNSDATTAGIKTTVEIPEYTSGGYASVIINKPVDFCFNTLTNVKLWPEINAGVTRAITPENVVLEKGAKFTESITSPDPRLNSWQNEWTVEEFEPGKSFVIAGRDNFSKEEIHTRITYMFSGLSPASTLFKRTTEVTVDSVFVANADKIETEGLYRFLGSQWEMAMHLKKFVEAQDTIAE